MSGLRRALLGLAVAGLAFGLLAGALVVTSDHRTDPVPFLVVGLAMGWGFIGIGLYEAWKLNRRRVLAITGPHTISSVAPVAIQR